MKVALISSYDLEGGAGRAAFRLHEALRESGVDASLSVLYRSSSQPGVQGSSGLSARLKARARWRLDHAPAQLLGLPRGEFSVNAWGGELAARLRALAPDVVHLHWLNAGFVSVAEIAALRLPVVWTAHDMWPFTGGCHYDQGCGRFETQGCGACPLQQRLQAWPLPSQRLTAKVAASAAAHLHFIGPSHWMASVAQRSPVARQRPVQVIPNAIDSRRFKPLDRQAARALFGLPAEQPLVLFGAVNAQADARKGFAHLQGALQRLQAQGATCGAALCVFGGPSRGTGTLHGLPVHEMGHLHDEESLVAMYSAADVFVAPSLQDNLPNTVLEANACNLPSVAFDIGGMSDLIEHRVSGWLAPAGNTDALADGLAHALQHPHWRQAAGRAARAAVLARFDYPVVAAAHGALYRRLLSRSQVPAAAPGLAS
ncbi:MAG: glycosyltransferase [Rubrivivax sp.]|nr:glycosyltransferase [Rubrivivax sp.]